MSIHSTLKRFRSQFKGSNRTEFRHRGGNKGCSGKVVDYYILVKFVIKTRV